MVTDILEYVVLNVYCYSCCLNCKQMSLAAIYPRFQGYVSVSSVVGCIIIVK